MPVKMKNKKDFRTTIEKESADTCDFCIYERQGEKIVENDYAFAKPDKHPVTPGHTLIIPKRHFPNVFDMTRAELNAVFDLLQIRRKQLLEEDSTIDGFNIGANAGHFAGQTVFHCHIHLIPRRKEEVISLRGGAEGVMRDKLNYPLRQIYKID